MSNDVEAMREGSWTVGTAEATDLSAFVTHVTNQWMFYLISECGKLFKSIDKHCWLGQLTFYRTSRSGRHSNRRRRIFPTQDLKAFVYFRRDFRNETMPWRWVWCRGCRLSRTVRRPLRNMKMRKKKIISMRKCNATILSLKTNECALEKNIWWLIRCGTRTALKHLRQQSFMDFNFI